MSYATIKAGFTTVLSAQGYSECKSLLEFEHTPLSYNHKWYVFKVESFETVDLLDNELIGTHLFRLEIRYKNTTTAERDTNYALFIALAKLLSAVAGFLGFEEATFIDEGPTDSEYHTKGTLRFFAGAEACT